MIKQLNFISGLTRKKYMIELNGIKWKSVKLNDSAEYNFSVCERRHVIMKKENKMVNSK